MAQGQDGFTYTTSITDELVQHLSNERFATYLAEAKLDRALGFELYLYNARLAKAFLFPLGVVEVALRNAVHAVLQKAFGHKWHQNPTFLALLTEPGKKTLEQAIIRSSDKKNKNPTPSQLVATLTLDFWCNIFNDEYHTFWQQHIRFLFKNNETITRAEFRTEIREINNIRNRIAHHEPILKADLTLAHSRIMRVIGYCSQGVREWALSHSTVVAMLHTRPSKSATIAETNLKERCDRKFNTMHVDDPLAHVKTDSNTAPIFCLDRQENLVAVLSSLEISKFFLAKMDDSGLFDINEHTLVDVCDDIKNSFIALPGSMPLRNLRSEFRKNPKVTVAVILEDKTPIGYITKAHRIY